LEKLKVLQTQTLQNDIAIDLFGLTILKFSFLKKRYLQYPPLRFGEMTIRPKVEEKKHFPPLTF